MHTDKQANFVWTAFHLYYFTFVRTANSPRLLYLAASWLVAWWFLSGELVGGVMASWRRVGWWRNSLVVRRPDTATRDRDNKAHAHTIHIYLPFTTKSKRWKSKDVKIVAVEMSVINSVPLRSKFSRVLTLSKTRPLSDVWNCEHAKT